MPSSQVPVLSSTDGFLSPFPDSLPQLFLRCLPRAFAFGLFPFLPHSFVRFRSGSGYLASVSSFPLSTRLRLTVASSVLPLHLSTSLLFPVRSNLISHVFFPGSSYSASCSFPFIPPGFAPTAVPPVLPFCSRFRAFPSPSAFFRPLLLGSDYLAFRSFLSLLPVLPCRRFLRCFSPLPSGLFPCLPSDSGTWLPAFPFSLAVSPHSGYLSASAFFLSAPGFFPFAFALGSGYLA